MGFGANPCFAVVKRVLGASSSERPYIAVNERRGLLLAFESIEKELQRVREERNTLKSAVKLNETNLDQIRDERTELRAEVQKLKKEVAASVNAPPPSSSSAPSSNVEVNAKLDKIIELLSLNDDEAPPEEEGTPLTFLTLSQKKRRVKIIVRDPVADSPQFQTRRSESQGLGSDRPRVPEDVPESQLPESSKAKELRDDLIAALVDKGIPKGDIKYYYIDPTDEFLLSIEALPNDSVLVQAQAFKLNDDDISTDLDELALELAEKYAKRSTLS